jgi:hypothetical protein
MLKHHRENRVVNCLICWKCHGWAAPSHFSYAEGAAVCGMCGEKNPLANLRKLPLGAVTATREIILCFVPRNGYNVHALHIDAKTVLGPWVHVASHETVLRMMEYLGATKEQLATHCEHQRYWAQGSSKMRLLPNKRNLLKIDYRLL